MFKSTTARETSIEKRGVGGKTLHGERGDRCRRVTGTKRCRKRRREEREEMYQEIQTDISKKKYRLSGIFT